MVSFMGAVVVGTLTHELGHYSAARQYTDRVWLHYNSTSWIEDPITADSIVMLRIRPNKTAEETDRFRQHLATNRRASFYSLAGGPLVTILIGTSGFIALWFYSRQIKHHRYLPKTSWLLIFLSLFWLRQVFNLGGYYYHYFTDGKMGNDEVRLAAMLGWPQYSIAIVTGLTGLAIAATVFYRYVPRQLRFTFAIAGASGCALGYLTWFYLLGPTLLP